MQFYVTVIYRHKAGKTVWGRKMKITQEILERLREAVENNGGAVMLSRKSGVDAANISRYLNGKVLSIGDDNWAKLAPYLRENISVSRSETVANTPQLRECIKDAMMRKGITTSAELTRLIGYDSTGTMERLLSGKLEWFPDVLGLTLSSLDVKYEDAPLTPSERAMLAPRAIFQAGGVLVRPLPVVNWANAASHLATMESGESVGRFWNSGHPDTVLVPVGGRHDTIAFRVSGISMEPKICDSDVILVEPAESLESIPANKIVVARLIPDGDVVCKRLRRQGEMTILASDNPEGRMIPVSPENIDWIGIVVRRISEL